MTDTEFQDRFSLTGRRVLVTGGSVSIGRAIAIGCAAAGADVAIQFAPAADSAIGLPDASAGTCAAIEARGRRSFAVPADFLNPGDARRTVEAVRQAWNGLDILVICASVQMRQDFATINRDAIDRQVAINFAATIELVQAALPGMIAQRWGRVLSIGSVNQLRPDPELAIYAALKAAQHNLIVNLAARHATQGVTFNTLSPGLVATERNRWRRQDAVQWEAIQAAANPMARAGAPEEMVGAALLLCSAAGSFITGADLPVDGGAHL